MLKYHKWTEEELDIVRRDYRGTNDSAQRIADRLGVTFNAVKGKVACLGIQVQKSPDWSGDDLNRLAEMIHRYSIPQIAKKLHRSNNAVKIKATRLKMGLRSRDDWFTSKEVGEICGVDPKKVRAWIDSGALKARYHNGNKPSRKGTNMWHIEAKDLRSFIIRCSGELLGRNVDIQQITWLLAGSEV